MLFIKLTDCRNPSWWHMQLVLLKVRLIILLCDRRTKQRFVMSRSCQMKNMYQCISV